VPPGSEMFGRAERVVAAVAEADTGFGVALCWAAGVQQAEG
jgi:hypothetical protein